MGIAAKWNRLESLPTLSLSPLRRGARAPSHQSDRRSTRVGGSRGASNPCRLLGSVTASGSPRDFPAFSPPRISEGAGASNLCGVRDRLPLGPHAQIFFPGAKRLNTFLEIKDSNDRALGARDGSRVRARACGCCMTAAMPRRRFHAHYFSVARGPRGAGQFSTTSRSRTAWQRCASFREIRKSFFWGPGHHQRGAASDGFRKIAAKLGWGGG